MGEWNPQVNELFLDALGHPAGAERDAWLRAACAGNEQLSAKVASLLDAGERAGDFLSTPPASGLAAPGETPADYEVSALIGPYKLLQELGEGGMGVVYLAEQLAPLRRLVALKIVRPGMDSRQVAARFEIERQALALMDHPNIAKVLDAGTTDAGRPYFVMELVSGSPITSYCDEHELSLDERLKLFITVCQAVQHAHQKGVIHRDLKPSNVLIALYDGAPTPKVIDFGVAKATGPKLTERTMFTEFGTVVGTLEYMSPEQAELNHLDVDTRSDVYSLGVILYELLTGATPLAAQRLETSTFDEMRRMIREDTPPKPSTRISRAGGSPAAGRPGGKSPTNFADRVRGDVDWIVMKALEKDRTRRYETADALGRDLERYLAREPIEARPPSAMYRVQMFAFRHRGPAAAAAMLALALVGGIAASTYQAFRATRAERAALANAAAADAAASAERHAREDETQQRRKAEDLSAYLVDTLRELVPQTGQSNFAPALIESADKLKNACSNNPETRASLSATLARSYIIVKRYDEAVRELKTSLELSQDPELIDDCRYNLAHCLLRIGKLDDGFIILRDLLDAKVQRAIGPDADELRAAWEGLPHTADLPEGLAGQDGLELDGDRDYVIVPDLQFDGHPPWTLEAIVRPVEIDQYSDPSGSHWTSLVSASDGGSICLEGNNRKWSMGLYTADIQNNDWTENYSSAFGADEIRLGEWQHVAGVWDGVELRLYLNGRLEGTKTDVEFCSQLSEGPFLLGADPSDWRVGDMAQGYLHGRLRSVRISHGVEYKEPFSKPTRLTVTPATLALYDFTTDTGRYAVDRSGHGRHGIIVGAKFVASGK